MITKTVMGLDDLRPTRGAALLEVQGSGQRFVDASNTTTIGTTSVSANQISCYITFSLDKSALDGTPSSGWTFTIVLTGQDGFSPDQAQGFQPTPQDFQFGVCATASTDPHCTIDPTTAFPNRGNCRRCVRQFGHG